MSKKSKKVKRTGLAGFMDSVYAPPEEGQELSGQKKVIRTIADALVGVPVGIGIGGAAGLWSLPIGLVLIGAGHHFKDQSGLLRIAGASAIAYGIAKNVEFNAAAKQAEANGISGLAGATEGIKERLKMVKDDLMAGYFLDRIFKTEETPAKQVAKSTFTESAEIGAIDFSELDAYDDYNRQEAEEFEASQEGYEESRPSYELDNYTPTESLAPTSEASFAMFDQDDNPDSSDL
jgi:hypothetical protein